MVLADFKIEEIKKEVLRCKKILELLNFEVRLEKIQNKICYTRFFDKDKITITTNAIMWNKASWQDFTTIKAFVSTKDILTNDETKWLILKEIYSKCLNNISNFQ